MATWVKLRGNGGYVNLAQVTRLEPEEASGQWRAAVYLTSGTQSVGNIDNGPSAFTSAADCSAFIAELVHGYVAA